MDSRRRSSMCPHVSPYLLLSLSGVWSPQGLEDVPLLHRPLMFVCVPEVLCVPACLLRAPQLSRRLVHSRRAHAAAQQALFFSSEGPALLSAAPRASRGGEGPDARRTRRPLRSARRRAGPSPQGSCASSRGSGPEASDHGGPRGTSRGSPSAPRGLDARVPVPRPGPRGCRRRRALMRPRGAA